jgi:hypothetical protein
MVEEAAILECLRRTVALKIQISAHR